MRLRTETPTFRRRSLDYSPAQLARQSAIGVEITALARAADRTAHRFAPDGTPLIRYAGTNLGAEAGLMGTSGDTMTHGPRPSPLADRLWAKVEKTETCWIWNGQRTKLGYGTMWVNEEQTKRVAHRVAYELLVGPVPAGLELDHLCRNRACVNPSHLEAVTHRENVIRGVGFSGQKARQTACVNGHPFTADNTRYFRTSRRCKACDRERHAVTKALRLDRACAWTERLASWMRR